MLGVVSPGNEVGEPVGKRMRLYVAYGRQAEPHAWEIREPLGNKKKTDRGAYQEVHQGVNGSRNEVAKISETY